MFKYQSAGDCQQRLAGSLIMVNGRPFYVREAKSSSTVLGFDSVKRDREMVVDLIGNCITTPLVGYYNSGDRAIYVTRKPVRRIRQGVCRENLTSSRGAPSNDSVASKAFGEMAMGIYPSLETAYNTTVTRQHVSSMAFSRDFAVTNEGKLLYCDEVVGVVSQDLTVKFNGKSGCLKELYESQSQRPSS